jgi:hypothetical protein
MRAFTKLCSTAAISLALAAPAAACPVCDSETGRTIRAGIFDDDFGANVLLTLLPFPVLAGVVVLIHYAFPNPRLSLEGGAGDAGRDEGAAR